MFECLIHVFNMTDVKNQSSLYGVQYVPNSICNQELILRAIFTLCTIYKQCHPF